MVGGGGGKFGKVWVENLNKPDQKYFPLSTFFFGVSNSFWRSSSHKISDFFKSKLF